MAGNRVGRVTLRPPPRLTQAFTSGQPRTLACTRSATGRVRCRLRPPHST